MTNVHGSVLFSFMVVKLSVHGEFMCLFSLYFRVTSVMLGISYGYENLGVDDDVIKWKHFPRYSPFVRGIHLSPVKSPSHP